MILFITGCNHWPDHSERVVSITDRYPETPEAVDQAYLKSLWDIGESRMAFVVNKGAEYCMPGQIKVVRSYLRRAKMEIDGSLFLDAQYSVATAMEQLDYVNRLMSSLSENSECLDSFVSFNGIDTPSEDFSHELAAALNCECDQISSSGEISVGFHKRLLMVYSAMENHPEIFLSIYSVDENAGNEITNYFSSKGINTRNIENKKGVLSPVLLSSDGLAFSVDIRKQIKKYRLREWRDSIDLESTIIRSPSSE
ncbi:hypothetical protein [Endozoicomonas numazuensis]|nr:hypothetical protein [Endozoicomonas numazuensis]